ncbi:serine acetyltransferase 5-like isoform X2 [Primulina eburnea]|uniref:serine acetyltransferase 5-like isoform X2 n=2 Tax=Primulina eburnea TaxID=1245227 RepID=UPI003C6CB9F3
MPAAEFLNPSTPPPPLGSAEEEAWVWNQIKSEARCDADAEPALASYLYATILSHSSLERSLSFHLGNKLCCSTLLSTLLYDLFLDIFSNDATLRSATVADLRACRFRDPACVSFSHCLLNYKGFLACQAHRVAHKLWTQSRKPLALALQSRISDVFAVDIHPAAKVGKGILFDHATGVVVGETAVIGNNVSILHHVTLGGTGNLGGDRHPKIGDGVLIGAGATILGNVKIGEGAKIGAGSMVLRDVPPRTTAVGNPARLVGGKEQPTKHEETPGESMDHTSFISDLSNYSMLPNLPLWKGYQRSKSLSRWLVGVRKKQLYGIGSQAYVTFSDALSGHAGRASSTSSSTVIAEAIAHGLTLMQLAIACSF